jgi:type II secretory pathway component PulK
MSAVGNRRGLVLVGVLWVIMVLIVIAVAVGRNSRLDTRVCLAGTEELRCKWASRAGIETAIGVLNEDLRASDSLTDLWSENDEDFNDVELKQCWFTAKVVDEAGKLNINTATREQLVGLEYMMEEIADAIIDWRDDDERPSGRGVEGGYYQNLRYGYMIRNGPFKTIRELLLVKGVTAELFYGEDTNFNGELDYNERDGDESPPADNGDDELDRGWIAYLTCYSYDNNKDAYGNERININEADEKKLQESLKIKKSYAKWIVENRKKNQYKSIADLINEQSPKKPKKDSKEDSDEAEALDLKTFSNIADKITVKGDGKIAGRININTAPRDVLIALLGGDENAVQAADKIIAYRKGLMYGMESIAEVMNVESVKIGTFKKIANDITTRSDVFTVRCLAIADRGSVKGATLQTEAVVDRSSTPCKVLYWYQGTGPHFASYRQMGSRVGD